MPPTAGLTFTQLGGRVNKWDNWEWNAVKVIEVPEDQLEKYKNQKYRADMTTLRSFKERDYMDALSYIGVIPE